MATGLRFFAERRLRYDSKYTNLDQRDREIANLGTFRKSLFDYDVEKIAFAYRSEH